jgi:hypothetical protein
MKKVDLGQTINTLANVGVVIGIVFLVVEIRQNSELLELEYLRTANDRAISNIDLTLNNPWLLETLQKEPGNLTEAETETVFRFTVRQFLVWEEIFEQIASGQREPEEFLPAWRQIYWDQHPAGGPQDYWQSYGPRARPEFVQFIEANVIAPGSP